MSIGAYPSTLQRGSRPKADTATVTMRFLRTSNSQNGTARYDTFGGWKRLGFGDFNQHGPDSIRFYTKTKTVTARWPSGIKEGAEFGIPTMK